MSITTSLRNYLIVAIRNNCLNYIRKENLISQYRDYVSNDNITADEDDIYTLAELKDLLENALDKLPEKYRIVFELHRMEGKKYEEIAKALNLSVRTVKRYHEQTISALKKDLKDYLPLLIAFIHL
jgi:RNA polymerase sigma-70 factor (ECF subfamily)